MMDKMFTLANLPMPPSSNHQYAARSFMGQHAKNFKGEKKAGFSLAKICPTSELERFEKEVRKVWTADLQNNIALHKCRATLREWIRAGKYIRIETYAFFPYFDLFTKEGLPRIMDGTNRLKALHDVLAELLEVDDSWFWDAEVKKRVDRKDRKFCVVRFRPVANCTLQEMVEKGEL